MIKLEHMSKYYGAYPAVIDASFEILRGEIVGFLGPNGAGKTTTMRVLTGFTPPTVGEATIGGFNVMTHSLDARRHIGYLPETVPLYLDMTVTDYLTYMGQIRGMNMSWIKERLPVVIDQVQLGDYRDTLVGKLSKGYRQRTGIAQAIIHEPDVLILDEPTIGIDPIQVVETRQLIVDLGNEHTLLLSSHILPEVSMICQKGFGYPRWAHSRRRLARKAISTASAHRADRIGRDSYRSPRSHQSAAGHDDRCGRPVGYTGRRATTIGQG